MVLTDTQNYFNYFTVGNEIHNIFIIVGVVCVFVPDKLYLYCRYFYFTSMFTLQKLCSLVGRLFQEIFIYVFHVFGFVFWKMFAIRCETGINTQKHIFYLAFESVKVNVNFSNAKLNSIYRYRKWLPNYVAL